MSVLAGICLINLASDFQTDSKTSSQVQILFKFEQQQNLVQPAKMFVCFHYYALTRLSLQGRLLKRPQAALHPGATG